MTRAGAQKQPDELCDQNDAGFHQATAEFASCLAVAASLPFARSPSLQDNATVPAGHGATRSGDETGLICAVVAPSEAYCVV
jgi:hypothetical protein